MSRVLLLDNYDSFTYNLVQALRILGAEVDVRTNDSIGLEEARELEPSHLVVSPGPGRPEAAGESMKLITAFLEDIPILGVCLGHQAIAAALGGTVDHASELRHGKPSPVYHDSASIYAGLPNPFDAGRYHSLAVMERDLPDDLVVTAFTSDGVIMGIRHRSLPVEGVQFHPESMLTPHGELLLRNFLDLSAKTPPSSAVSSPRSGATLREVARRVGGGPPVLPPAGGET
jgi:anthranilate synthase/aminodeoxychorismate synthase-like glutamine amidotransferase